MKKLIIANWKMNPESVLKAKELFLGIKKTARTLSNVQTVIAPPFVYLRELSLRYRGHRIAFSGQDMFWEKKGSFTGEISGAMLKDAGASYVIIGHSERRALGESDDMVHKKIKAALKASFIVVVCIGEKERDHQSGNHFSFLSAQLESALQGISKSTLQNVVIAYEPIWAIGKTQEEAMKAEELHETVLFIRKIIAQLFGKNNAFTVPILYGGSAEKGNTEALFTKGMVDGLLVGHASLKVNEFSDMLRIAHKI